MTRDNLLDDLEAMVAAVPVGEWWPCLHWRNDKRGCGDTHPGYLWNITADYVVAQMGCQGEPPMPHGTQDVMRAEVRLIAALKNAAPELLRRAREKDKMVAAYDEALWLARCQRDQASVRGNRAEASRDMLAEALREIIAQAKALGSDEFTLDQVADVARAALAKIDALSRTTSTTEEGKP